MGACPLEDEGTQLDREAEPTVVAAVEVDDDAVAVIQMKVTIQLLLCGLAREPAISASLIIGEKADRHASPIPGEVICKTYPVA
jgi:hypothetical protein